MFSLVNDKKNDYYEIYFDGQLYVKISKSNDLEYIKNYFKIDKVVELWH